MEYNENEQERLLRSDTGEHQFVILTQLLQAAAQMQHVDELFLWLTRKMVQQLRLEVVQIWTMETALTSQSPAILRATSLHDQSIPEHVIMNTHVTNVVNDILSRRQAMLSQPVGNLFSPYQSSLLGRYGLDYCTCCLITSSNLALPPVNGSISAQQATSVPSVVAALAFLSQPRPQHFLIAINQFLGQALQIAKKQGLLQISSIHEAVTADPNTEQRFPPLHELVPVRTRSRDSMRSSNPFTSAALISDKRALAFFGAIDGSRTIAEIAALRKMDGRDMVVALRLLLQQKRIQLYTKEGQLVEGEVFFKMM
jgi:hypothetical protein